MPNPAARHCERSEAIQAYSKIPDCFVAYASLRKRFAFAAGNDENKCQCANNQ